MQLFSIWVRKRRGTGYFFVLFHMNINIIEKLILHLANVRILGTYECGTTRCYEFMNRNINVNIKPKTYYVDKFSDKTGICL